jgi:hypothetical protein
MFFPSQSSIVTSNKSLPNKLVSHAKIRMSDKGKLLHQILVDHIKFITPHSSFSMLALMPSSARRLWQLGPFYVYHKKHVGHSPHITAVQCCMMNAFTAKVTSRKIQLMRCNLVYLLKPVSQNLCLKSLRQILQRLYSLNRR